MLLLLACASPPSTDSDPSDTAEAACEPGLDLGACPPDVTLLDREGASVSLLSFRGDATVLASEAEWCTSCQQLVQGLQVLYADRAADGLAVVDVLVEDTQSQPPDAADIAEWSDYFGLTYTILADPEGVFLPAYGGDLSSAPFVFYVLDGDGAVVWSALREDTTTLDQITTAVETVLGP